MMKADKLKPVQIMTMIVGAILSVDILLVQREMVLIAKQDAWISLLLGGVLTIILALIFYKLATLYPTKDLPQIFLDVGGKIIGRMLIIPVTLYCILYTGLSLRIFAQALKTFLLDKTPIYAVITLMFLVVSYAVYKGIYTIGGLIDVLFPMCLFTVIILAVLSLQQIEPAYIKPILYKNIDGVLKGIVPADQMYAGYGLFAYLYCHVDQQNKTLKWYLIGIIIPIVLYTALTVLCIMVFNKNSVISLAYPALTLSKSIEFPTTFLERLEAFITVLWIGIVFMSLIMFYHAVCRDTAVFFKIGEKAEKYIAFALTPLIIFVATVIRMNITVIDLFDKIKNMHTFNVGVIVPMVLIVSIIKRKRSGSK